MRLMEPKQHQRPANWCPFVVFHTVCGGRCIIGFVLFPCSLEARADITNALKSSGFYRDLFARDLLRNRTPRPPPNTAALTRSDTANEVA
jgi:hypothetical protein